MGKTLIFLMFLVTNACFAQLTDDFSDGDFTVNPPWVGQGNNFLVNASGQLQTNGPQASSTVYLCTANSLANKVVFSFRLNLGFDPSTTNYPRIYLLSNQQDLSATAGLQGYYLQLGSGSNAENFSLVRQNGNTSTTILALPDKTRPSAGAVNVSVRVERDEYGVWDVYTDFTGGANYTLDGSITDNTYTATSYFGFYCRYATASRYNLYRLDDVKVEALATDITPPMLTKVTAVDGQTLDVFFSEALDQQTALSVVNYNLSALQSMPVSVTAGNMPNVYRLSLSQPLSSGNYTLTVTGIKDAKGNVISNNNTANFTYVKPYVAKVGDVVINEIFADQTPQVGLPSTEFVELWNTTSEYILLNGWKFSDLTTTYTFGVDTLLPNSYVLLCPATSVADYRVFGKTIGLSPWPSLNNDKDQLQLVSNLGAQIAIVAYADTWYKDSQKAQGGYSLELIDPKNNCVGIQNWMASGSSSGGTPGKQNSAYQSQYSSVAPKLMLATIVDANTIRLTFSKSLDSAVASVANSYQINNGIGSAITASAISPAFTTVELKLGIPLVRGLDNLLTIANVADCAGNVIDPTANFAKLFWAKEILPNDFLISEVLSNPREGGVDYVEIYNKSDHVLDLKDLQLANSDASGNPANAKAISATSVFVQPGQYWVLTTNPTVVMQQYNVLFPNQFAPLASMPSFNNDKGTVILLSNGSVIDRFDYTEDMHLALLRDVNGVALERISLERPAHEKGNFSSAAQTVGYGTPTYKNSQTTSGSSNVDVVSLSSKMLSPDGDGFEDLLRIDYRFAEAGKFATVNIYTDKGVLIRRLQRNSTLGTSGTFTWDGIDDGGQLAKVGIYIIKFDVFSLNGNKRSYTKNCVLAAKL